MHMTGPGRSNYRVMNDAIALVAAGYHVTIVDVVNDCKQPVVEEVAGIQFRHICAPGWFIATRFKFWFLLKVCVLMIRCTVQLLHVQADIYHAHVEHSFIPTYLVARLYRKGLILDTPELTMFGPNILRWPRLRCLSIQCIRWLARSCDGYITGSPLYGPILADLYHLNNVLILRHIPPYRAVKKNTRLHQYLSLEPTVKIVLYQGYIQADRGLELLIHAAGHLAPDVVIVLMGNSYGDTMVELTALIHDKQVTDRVKFVPAKPYAELLDWTSAADLGLILLPPDYSLSIRYCLPNKFFEYLMAGVPMLTAHLDAIVPLIQHYHIGHVLNELTPLRVAQAITMLLSNQEALHTMHNNALNVVTDGLSWEVESQRLVKLYHAISVRHTGTSIQGLQKD